MEKGKIIYLNGVTSTGKTSIARMIQDIANDFFYLIGSDILMYMVGEKHKVSNYAKYEYEMFIDMYHIAKLLSDMGKNVFCSLETCRERNIKRGDRGEFQSEKQEKIMDKTVKLDFSVNTDKYSSEECEKMILHKLY